MSHFVERSDLRRELHFQTYEEACAAATTRQGLDPLIERLTAEGISHYVAQTGGFTMVVMIEHGGEFGIINDEGIYSGAVYVDGDETDAYFQGSLDDVIAIIKAGLAPGTVVYDWRND